MGVAAGGEPIEYRGRAGSQKEKAGVHGDRRTSLRERRGGSAEMSEPDRLSKNASQLC